MAHSSLRIDRSTATAGVEPNAPEEINLREIGEKFFDFLSTFQEEFDEGSGDEQSNTGLYIRLLGVLVEQQRRTLDVDFKHIEAYDRDLAYAISVRLLTQREGKHVSDLSLCDPRSAVL